MYIMNKNIKNLLAAITLLAVITSCDSKLDVAPTQSIDETNALATAQDVEVTLIGAYDGMSSSNLYGGAIQYSGELLGDDSEVRFTGTYTTLDELWRKTVTTTHTQTRDTWTYAYSAIDRANNVISASDKVGASDKGRVEGAARFIRGAMYFELVRLWGKDFNDGDANTNLGVPLVLTPTRGITDADYTARATVAAVYKQVIEDLTKAATLLPETSASDNFGFASSSAATAILSRVYLQQGKYAEALAAANSVIESGNHELASSFADAFSDDTNEGEVIFRVLINEQDGVNSMNTFYAPTTFQGRGDIRIQSKHLGLYEAGDERASFFVKASGNTFSAKYLDQYGDVPVIRLAELYLTRAECNQRLGSKVGASPENDINMIRERSGLSPLTSINLTAILKERKLELAFEGLQVHDAKRLKKNVTSSIVYNANQLVLPIPQREIDTNKSLVQNPGYNN